MSAPGPILAVVLAFAVLAAFLAELHSLLRWNARAVLRCQLDMRLTEPGELVTLSYRLGNTAPWPLTTVSVTFRFDSAVEILEERGVIGPARGAGPREILVDPETLLNGGADASAASPDAPDAAFSLPPDPSEEDPSTI